MEAPLLVELLTEELPPRSLPALRDAFADQLLAEMVALRLKAKATNRKAYATPRRLAVLIPDVRDKGLDSEQPVEGPLSSNQKAVEGFAKKHKIAPDALERRQAPKGEIVVAHLKLAGVNLDSVLAEVVDKVVKKLPIAKVMRWGDGDAQFVRPVHGLVMMHGSRVVPGNVLGAQSRGTTQGHRFMSLGPLALPAADDYEEVLRRDGMVLADFGERRAQVARQLEQHARQHGASLGDHEDLLDEVTALVEHPSVYTGSFDAGFLQIPHECLTLTMRKNQKYFPLFGAGGKLLPKFLIVSNMKVEDARHIVSGNERVVRPRLEDARFFYDQDRKQRLEARVPRLESVVYHNKLGSQLARVERIQLLAGTIARMLGADAALTEHTQRAAWLAKADLLSGMVGEFPELQGIIGRYYALHDGEPAMVADAIEAHYRPRYAGDRLPQGTVACAVALADKLDTLAGLFGIGEHPTGDKDPFGLRRAALGVVRIVVENELPLSLSELVDKAFDPFKGKAQTDLSKFIYDRFSGYLKEKGFSTLQVDAVLSKQPVRLSIVPRQLEAVRAFEALPEAGSLAAANKRVANILRQAASKGESYAAADRKELRDRAEIDLYEALQTASSNANALYERGDYAGYLKTFAVLKAPVDTFFEKVMVMAEQATLRRNRLALLNDLREAMNRVADISKLAQ